MNSYKLFENDADTILTITCMLSGLLMWRVNRPFSYILSITFLISASLLLMHQYAIWIKLMTDGDEEDE